MLNRRRVGWFALPLLLSALSAWAQTEAWPTKPIRLVVTFPPGGSSDAAARIVAPRLAEKLGQPVVIDNRPGAGGGVGLDLVAKAPADGYTIVLASAEVITGVAALVWISAGLGILGVAFCAIGFFWPMAVHLF